MDQEERLTVSSASLLEETVEKQTIRQRFGWLSTLLLVCYILLPFFRSLPKGDLRSCTAFLAELPKIAYFWIEGILAALLILLRHFRGELNQKGRPRKRSRIELIRMITSFFCLLAIILTNSLPSQIPLGLVLQVPLIVCCSDTVFQLVCGYFNVLRHNLRYFLLMWLSICLFWIAGDLLFEGYELPSSANFFQSFFDTGWNLLVLQSTANFPDVALPFFSKHMASFLYFVLFLFCNTTIVSNMIVANSYSHYKQTTETYELTNGLQTLLRDVIKKKKEKAIEAEVIKGMTSTKKLLFEVVNNTFYRLTQWVLNVVLFLVVSYHPSGLNPSGILFITLALTVILSFSTLVLALIMPLRLVLKKPFLVYDLIVVFVTLAVHAFILVEDQCFSYLSPYLAMLRVPYIFKPILQYLFKNVLASLQYTNPAKGIIEVQYKLTPRIIRVLVTLFIVMLQFSGVGVLLYQGLIEQQSKATLIKEGLNPNYIYTNFNSTMNSFITLFSLLMVNNWNNIVASFVVLSGTYLTRIYFMVFYMFGVLVAYTILETCIIECVVSLAERKKAQIKGYNASKSHSEKIKDKLVDVVKQSLTTRNYLGEFNDDDLLKCIEQEINEIQSKNQEFWSFGPCN